MQPGVAVTGPRRSRPLLPVGRCSLDRLGPACCPSQALRACRVGTSSSGTDRHALGRQHAAAFQLPVFVLLQQHRPHQAGDGGVVGEDAHGPGALLDLLFHPLLSDDNQVGAPDFALVDLREVAERQHALLGLMHERSGLGEAFRQRGRQITRETGCPPLATPALEPIA